MYTPENERPVIKEGVALMKRGLQSTLLGLNELHTNTLILGDTPYVGQQRIECAVQHNLPRKSKSTCSPLPLQEVLLKQGISEKAVMEVGNEMQDVEYHSIISSHCKEGACPIFINDDYIYRDSSHIRRNLSDRTKKALVESFGLRDMIDWKVYTND